MIKPLAVVFYERLLPGSQLVNRLQDLGYRVQTISEPALLPKTVLEERPLVMILDLVSKGGDICGIIREIKTRQETGHIPVIGFAGQNQKKLHADAVRDGANLVAFDDALLLQLPHLLEQALLVE
jgi:CheY-like chemotaxis protein